MKFSLLQTRLYLPLSLPRIELISGFGYQFVLFHDRAANQAAMPMTPVAVS